MQDFRKHHIGIGLLALIMTLGACKKKITQNVEYSNVIYELNDETLYESNLEKNKQKSAQQYVSIMYSDLYGTALSSAVQAELAELQLSIGDKGMSTELFASDWIFDPAASVPTDAAMRADIEGFIENTFIRFFLRYPTPYEAIYIKGLIEADPDLSPELVYTAFTTANEYYYY